MSKPLFRLAIVSLIALALVGCSKSKSSTTTAVANQGGDKSPAIVIIAPKAGATVGAGDLDVKVDTQNFKVVDKIGQSSAPGEGHLAYYLDTNPVPTNAGQPAVTGANAVETTDHSHTWHNVAPGSHKVAVQLVNNDHMPLNPPVVAMADVVTH